MSWAYAWKELKTLHPTATSKVIKSESGCLYHNDGRTCWVEVAVVVDAVEHIEYYPVLNFSNAAIPVKTVTTMHINTAIQRATTKAIARHGLGLAIYANEDLIEIKDQSITVAAKVFNADDAKKHFNTLTTAEDINKAKESACARYQYAIPEIDLLAINRLNALYEENK